MLRLASHRDKAEVANAGTIGLRVTVKNRYLQATPRSKQRMGEAKNARADDHEIKGLMHDMMTPRLKTALSILHCLRQSLAETRH
jgi:hypothetical protein